VKHQKQVEIISHSYRCRCGDADDSCSFSVMDRPVVNLIGSYTVVRVLLPLSGSFLQCFDAVCWAAGRASGL